METSRQDKLSLFTIFLVFCIPVLTSNAGILDTQGELVEPGGVEIPAIVNVIGPEEPNDANDVKEIFRTANNILKQANVQFNVKWITTGITEVGDGDGLLSENEFSEVLHGSIFELELSRRVSNDSNDIDTGSIWMNRPRRSGKSIKFNIADDVWVERPELEFWHDIFYPVTFLESSIPPEQMGRILAREVSVSAGLSPSTDPTNLMYTDGEGTVIDEDQKSQILGLARQVGYVRSSLAEGYAQEVLDGLHHKQLGALFFSEGFTLRGDYHNDVYSEDAGGSQIGEGGVDLEAFIAKSGRIGTGDEERSLILKFYFGVGELPDDTFIDTYLRPYTYNKDSDNGNGFSNGDSYENFDAVIGVGISAFSTPYVGIINLSAGNEWVELSGIQPQVDYSRERTKVKVEIPLPRLTTHLPESVLKSLKDGCGLELQVSANSFSFDAVQGLVYQQDDIYDIKLAPTPKLLPRITSEYRYEDIDTSTLSLGFDVRTSILDEDYNSLDKSVVRDLLSQPLSDVEVDRAVYSWINFNTNANNDSFNSANGFPNNPYPGIDLSGGTDLLFITEARAMIEMSAGLHIFGLQGKDSAILQINPVRIGSLFHYNQYMQNGIDHGSNGDSVNDLPPYKGGWDDNHISVLQRGDSAFEVKDPGLYLLTVRALSQISAASDDDANETSGASLELQQVLPDGTHILIGDVINGGLAAYVPPEDIEIPDEPDESDGINGFFEGFEAGFIDPSIWTFGGDVYWFASMEQANSGSYSAQAGPIGDNQSSTLSFFGDFTTAGELSFWLKVSSEEGYDFLRFSLNGEVLGEWSGEQDWQQVFFPSRRGPNTFEWTFIKDSSSDRGEDTAWIDDFNLLFF